MKNLFCTLLMATFFFTSCAKGERKIVVYSPHPEALLEDVATRFEKEKGIKVEFLKLTTDAMIEYARSEKANPLADVLFGGQLLSKQPLKM